MKYRKKPVVVEAMRFTEHTKDQVFNWITCTKGAGSIDGKPVIRIQTLEGVMEVTDGDWVIKGVNGEFYPCKPDVFAKTYEPAGER
jgi:hypothetical protein